MHIDGRFYNLEVIKCVEQPHDVTRLLVVSYLPNEQALDILKTCIASIQKNTPIPHEIWVVDNHSPAPYANQLRHIKGINLVLSHTEPLPAEARKRWFWQQERSHQEKWEWGSYANAIGLEIAVRLIDPTTTHIMTLHQDTAATHPDWLGYLHSKMTDRVGAVGVRMQTNRDPQGILHILGCLIDFQIFKRLQLNFFPDLPRYDVGDLVTVHLRQQGYQVAACRNIFIQPELAHLLPVDSPLLHSHMDCVLNDENDIIFLHMGRGVRKSQGISNTGLTPENWVAMIQEHVLNGSH